LAWKKLYISVGLEYVEWGFGHENTNWYS
jgi:hypothetical protein